MRLNSPGSSFALASPEVVDGTFLLSRAGAGSAFGSGCEARNAFVNSPGSFWLGSAGGAAEGAGDVPEASVGERFSKNRAKSSVPPWAGDVGDPVAGVSRVSGVFPEIEGGG